MPVRKRPKKNCYTVTGAGIKKCLTKEQATRMQQAIKASKFRSEKSKINSKRR